MSDDPIGTELAQIRDAMRTDIDAYHRDEAMQGRHLELLRAREAGADAAPPPPSSIDREIAEIKRVIRTDSARYWGDATMQARFLELIRLKEASPAPAAGEPGSNGLPKIQSRAQIAEQIRQETGRELSPHELHEAYGRYLDYARMSNSIVLDVPAETRASFQARFDALPEAVMTASAAEMIDRAPWASPIDHRALQAFQRLPEGAALVREWGGEAAGKLSIVQRRLDRWLDRCRTESAMGAALAWLDGLSAAEARAVFRAMAG